MIEETAQVVEIIGQQILLQTQRKSACQSCSVKSACGTSTLSKVVGKRSSQFLVEKTFDVQVGDQVVVAVEENALLQGSLLIYMLPLIFMLGFAMLAEVLLASELVTIVSAAAGLFLSIILVRYVLLRSELKNSIQPHLIRRLS